MARALRWKNARHAAGLAVLVLVVGLLGACRPATPSAAASSWRFDNPPRRPGTPLVVVLAPPREAVLPLIESLRQELQPDFDMLVVPVSGAGEAERTHAQLDAAPGDVVVLVDNPTVAVYRGWAQRQSRPPAAIIVMASFVDELQPTVPNSTGIAFEPPAVRTLTEMRSLLDRPVRRAGVVYRERFEAFVARQQQQAEVEQIELVAIQVESQPTSGDVARALRRLRRARVDAVWVSNDDVLLTPPIIAGAWVPFVERAELPIAVGVPALVNSRFGTFAAVPDIEALGVQASDLIYELSASGYRASNQPVQPPLSVKTYLDVARARALGSTPAGESRVDVLVGLEEGPAP